MRWKETCVNPLPITRSWKLKVGLRTYGCNSTRDTMPGAFSFHRLLVLNMIFAFADFFLEILASWKHQKVCKIFFKTSLNRYNLQKHEFEQELVTENLPICTVAFPFRKGTDQFASQFPCGHSVTCLSFEFMSNLQSRKHSVPGLMTFNARFVIWRTSPSCNRWVRLTSVLIVPRVLREEKQNAEGKNRILCVRKHYFWLRESFLLHEMKCLRAVNWKMKKK